MQKRTWCYLQSPKVYGISSCQCGNVDTQWSEYKEHLWCEQCQKDFIPENMGIFDGPIIVETCFLLGISFDRLNLETNRVEKFNRETVNWEESGDSLEYEIRNNK